MSKHIKVLVVDDSALMRQLLSTILENDPDIEVVGTAPDAHKARELIKKTNPDVITLDVEMPKMNGIDFLKKIMKLRPMPVIMISTLTQQGADVTFEALEIGAVDFVSKPQNDLQQGMVEISGEIISKVKTAAIANVISSLHDVVTPPSLSVSGPKSTTEKELIVIGASTGGVEALRTILQPLPEDMPPIFVVQHMPKQFTGTFSNRLNNQCQLTVHEAADGIIAERGNVYIAPGDSHLQVTSVHGKLMCCLDKSEPVGGHQPSVGVLFDSALNVIPSKTIGVMLSGMGRDGADAMLRLKMAGATNIGQNERSCVVYGMPKAAFERGAVDYVADLNDIAEMLVKLSRGA
ncbi:chemotaxis response regulator protein-glutamate methylesterase [Terasakiella sp. A23]|uniref:protein-glutamate methylesterase/protein-glutamine glutaminase n=1 Tax=Terasakiella sp. FCG-A23 TaxID=3080561 RepID=UPI00295410E5|nr:chemotaxis response regulator protein-glutamate methylesterase [Terasakiella sp. A23]MDV7338696.1 chemotaxis response regulator protein-glutamate methylesterase [Terasakiella sp. A23]